ncbi:hypothetical protein EJ05DRAFT_66568 [Pseudovirgaria hyperparasitica]|uniref:Uncharacterized protein n=1 Tax=Pseudovirgaria hyperparasitica TaxID=470096 RepID=A0A6A6W3G0_9PEZI|nr:uncharacterized protein EJ05DRAFT_66568 [Pseudovirgaria hyperparasitica]KAF2756516.1 hypothetical protein EJ05DRAFT_66568 [Pseudovirgaria hyperparasitica]
MTIRLDGPRAFDPRQDRTSTQIACGSSGRRLWRRGRRARPQTVSSARLANISDPQRMLDEVRKHRLERSVIKMIHSCSLNSIRPSSLRLPCSPFLTHRTPELLGMRANTHAYIAGHTPTCIVCGDDISETRLHGIMLQLINVDTSIYVR